MPGTAYSVLPHEERRAIADRVETCVRAIIHHRTGGKKGSRRDEQAELAAEIGVHPSTIGSWLGWHGARAVGTYTTNPKAAKVYLPRLDALMRLCVVGECSADWLLFGTGEAPAWVAALHQWERRTRKGRAKPVTAWRKTPRGFVATAKRAATGATTLIAPEA